MKIKKYKAKNFTEALELVKKELSEDAIILSTEEKKGLRPWVEVTAAVDYDHAGSKEATGQIVAEVSKRGASYPNVQPAPETLDSSAQVTVTEEIKNQISKLREAIEGMKNNGYEISLPAKKKMILDFLRERSVREEFALRICEKARDVEDIPALLSSDITVKEKSCSGKAVMLIGPTGVGKTTTIAKLSVKAIKEGRKVAVINLDSYRIGAVEQTRIYARILGIPLAIVSSAADLSNSLSSFARTRDIVFIDTTGRNPRDEIYIDGLLDICRSSSDHESLSGFPLELHLLMSANADDEFMRDSYKFYKRLPIDSIAFTKVDEAVRFGSLYNLMLTYQKPVAYITTGQTVPDDIEFINQTNLANLILKKGCFR
ncbi:MAG TPA: flagellar biosynthesis protein FlhF [Nitrospiraceae bacterium]|jgi:flagellar biosynthesis protein FlhF|nr:flagellar biosynthesis protein FlhF [Nitrospiraceae bacterium]